MEFQIRKAAVGEERDVSHIMVQTWRSTYRNILDAAYLDAMDENSERRLAGIRQKIADGHVYVAVSGGILVGFAIFGEARDTDCPDCAELYALYVPDAYQKTGIGRQLVRTVKSDLSAAGYKQMRIACLRENSSYRFYEKTGGRQIEEKTFTIGGRAYPLRIFHYKLSAL